MTSEYAAGPAGAVVPLIFLYWHRVKLLAPGLPGGPGGPGGPGSPFNPSLSERLDGSVPLLIPNLN